MKSLVIGNQKGGVGKTTLAMHIACLAKEKNLSVLLIDTDTQGTSSLCLQDVAEAQFNCIDLFESKITFNTPVAGELVLAVGNSELAEVGKDKVQQFVENVRSAQFDLVIIDTPPTMSALQLAPMIACDYMIMPFELNSFSTHGISTTMTTVENIQDELNPNLVFLGLLPSRFKSNDNAQKEILEQIKASAGHLLYRDDAIIPERQLIGMVANLKKPVWEIKDNSSCSEVTKIVKPVFENILNDVME